MKPSGSTRVTDIYSLNTQVPTWCYAALPKRSESLIKSSILHQVTLTLWRSKSAILQAEGDLPGAAALVAPLRPNADDTSALEAQTYQAILERQPAAVIPRLKEILAKPDPALGYLNGELRFWLGWAQDSRATNWAPRKVGDTRAMK